MLDLGHENDWFNSTFICALAVITVVGLIVFIIWELTERHPVVNIQIFLLPWFYYFSVVACLCL